MLMSRNWLVSGEKRAMTRSNGGGDRRRWWELGRRQKLQFFSVGELAALQDGGVRSVTESCTGYAQLGASKFTHIEMIAAARAQQEVKYIYP